IGDLGGRNISKTYDDQTQLLSYRFGSRDTALHLDEVIRQQIAATPALDSIVPGTATDEVLEYSYLQESPLARSMTILVQDLESDDSHNVARELIALVQETYGVDRLRQDYSVAERILKLRFSYQGKQSFLTTLYPKLISNESLTHLGIERQGKQIILTPLPAERKRLVIAGLTAERYHHRLGVYRSAITIQEGVTDVVHEYLASTAGQPGQLVFTFSHTGELTALENRIWTSLTAAGETPNRQLTAISNHMIQYQAGGEAVLTVFFRNVIPADYSQIRDSVDRIFKDLAVRNLERDYDDQAQLLAYRFESKQTAIQLDAALWQQIAATPALQDLVPGTATDEVLEYSYHQAIVTVQFNNIASGDYDTL
ncbi:MAG: hypothetical protein QGF90_04945, partial [Gammaproteobacteria bacterium]|nr:hypothetical protein [Gammaproteobacteria bacterium]